MPWANGPNADDLEIAHAIHEVVPGMSSRAREVCPSDIRGVQSVLRTAEEPDRTRAEVGEGIQDSEFAELFDVPSLFKADEPGRKPAQIPSIFPLRPAVEGRFFDAHSSVHLDHAHPATRLAPEKSSSIK